MAKTGKAKRCQELDKLGRHVVAIRIPHNGFSSIAFVKTVVFFETRLGYVKIIFFILTPICWVKSAWTVESILLTSILLMGRPAGDGVIAGL